VWWFAALMLILPLSTTGVLESLVRRAFPRNEFLFGKRKASFSKRQRLMGNLVWVVLVGLGVAVLAGLIVWRLTSAH
jgi:hypothetical protein